MEEKLFKSITEVSTELDLPAHVLRFWEDQFSEIRPVRRQGGRRYYHEKDVESLRKIKDMLYRQGYTIKGAKKMLRAPISNANQKEIKEFKKVVVKPVNENPENLVELVKLKNFIKSLKFDLKNLKDILSQN